ncbi:glycosyltransferase [Candidatus Bathyarchaeota archaeon]|nr:MAG: glycosyltransferase [Candidatus Bathyarchaeota archaeon]
MESWIYISGISLAFSIPGLLYSYYSVILFLSTFRYPRYLADSRSVRETPFVSILIATFNEKFVVANTLDALKGLHYPREKLQVVVADDSSDETADVIDRKVTELNTIGIQSVVSRREGRAGFKSGALNQAAPLLKGDYVLLLDADSTVSPDVLIKGLNAIGRNPRIGFVSFRVGHYNREQNWTTRLFALQLDQGDTVSKMGAYSIDAPYSFQGGFVLVSIPLLRHVGFWAKDSIVEDADLSCRIYCAGYRGVYLSDVRIFSEDPSSLEVWKKQAARVAQGWAKCAIANGRMILGCTNLSIWRRIVLFSTLVGPFQGLSWIVVTFVSALGLILGLSAPSNSIFSSPIYVILVTLPLVSFFASGIYALRIQKILSLRNLVLLPLLSYTSSCMTTAIMIGFLNGMRGKPGIFFRTPKHGPEAAANKQYHRDIRLDRIAIAEGILATAALAMSIIVLLDGVWPLTLTLAGFGALTLKSMNLSRMFTQKSIPTSSL